MGTTVRVIPHNGRTAIAVDDRVIPGMSYFTYMLHGGNLRREVLHEMVNSGTRLFFVLWQTWRPRHYAEPWTADGRLDFTPLDEWMAALAGMSDELWFIPRLFFTTPAWWADRYPEELVRFSDSELTTRQVDGREVIKVASMASERWRADVADVLRRIVEHVENGPYADRVLGYMLNSGGTEEWIYPGAQQGRIGDYSAPARTAFRGWLQEKYGDDAALASAWRQPDAAIATAEVPSEAARRRIDPAVARDPRLDMPAIDYELFLSDVCAGNLLDWCRVVKEQTDRRRLTGAFYGYLAWQSGYASGVVNNAHLGLPRLLESPDIDFITGITSYDNRGTGEPGSFMLPVESLQAAGKLPFHEVDIRTHLSGGRPNRSEIDQSFRNTYAYDAEESVAIYRREFAHQTIHGAAWWNFDMGGGWYACPELQEEFARQSALAQRALDWDMSSISEMAVVLSASSPAYQRLFTMQEAMADFAWLDLQCDRATTNLYYTGVPMDWRLTGDLGRAEMRRYKLLYIFNAMYMSQRERAWLETLKGDGRTLVFCGAAGLIADEGCDAAHASALTGMRLRLNPRRRPLTVEVTDYEHPMFRECESAVTLGTGALVGPALEIDDPESRVLGCWQATGAPAFAIKECSTWRSVVCPAPINHALLARGLACDAGCHVWVDPGRITFANRSLLAIHIADSHAPLRVHLPEAMDVTDLIAGCAVARDARHFVIQQDIRRHTTFLYHLQPAKQS